MNKTPLGDLPFVSIVVCTLNRKKLLQECLTSLYAMYYPRERYEIIVVDGGSTDGTEQIKKKFPDIRFVVEPRFGIAHARNRGAELAHGSIIAYTDDDCTVGPLWLKSLVDGFQESPTIMGVGGPVFPAFAKLPKQLKVNPALGLFDEGQKPKYVFGIITSNSAFKREVFESTRFDEALGATRRGQMLLCGEDVDFCTNIVDSKFKLFYEPEAKVYHKVREDRIKVQYIVRHAVTNGVSVAKIWQKKRDSRVWMLRSSMIGLVRSVSSVLHDRSFGVIYQIIVYFSASFVSIVGVEHGSLFVTRSLAASKHGIHPKKP
jgi:glycosyltransferase involved in cell wall biosynthesis